jgi:DNA polymerase-3 subunit alpha
MTSDFDNTDRLAIEINECKHMGIDVLQPDVNESFLEFAIVKDTNNVRFGLSAIKNVGAAAADEIIRARRSGHFESLEDFFERVDPRIVNRKALESLIKAGALDTLADRSWLLHNIDALLAFAQRLHKQAASGQADLFGTSDDQAYKNKILLVEPPILHTPQERLMWERELLGIFLSDHPLRAFEPLLKRQATPVSTISIDQHDRSITTGGFISDVREITTKSGIQMAFIKLSDGMNEVELVIFPKTYQQTKHVWVRDKVVLATGKISGYDRRGNELSEPKLLVESARIVSHDEAAKFQDETDVTEPERTDASPRVYIRLANSNDADILLSLKETIDNYQGSTDVVLVVGEDNDKQIIKLPTRMSATDESLDKLGELVGSNNVRMR